MSFKLIPLTDAHMTRQQVYLPRPKHFYPSEASVKYIDVNGVERVEGTCLRASWYRLKGGFEREATNPYGEWIFALGKAVEEILVEQWKQMGIWVGNNIKFYDKENDVSGEIDCMIRDPETGELVCLECLTPDSLILDSNYRFHTFENLVKNYTNEKIVSFTKTFNKIQNFQIKEVEDKTTYRFLGKLDGLLARFTEEHPLLIAKIKVRRQIKNNKKREYQFQTTEWKKAKEIKRGEYLCIPKAIFGKENLIEKDYQNIEYLLSNSNWQYQIKNNEICSCQNSARNHNIPSSISNLEDFYWLLGLYLAEGSCSKNAVYFSLHEEEFEIIEKIKKIVKDLFNLEVSVRKLLDTRTKKFSKGVNLSICSTALRELFKSIIKGNSIDRTKHLDYSKIFPSIKSYSSILKGAWDGDGCQSGIYRKKINTCVPNLAFLYFQLAAKLGLNPNLKEYQQQSQFNSDSIYSVEWSTLQEHKRMERLIDCEDFWCYKIKKIQTQKYSGKVYNLECEPDNSYTAGMVLVHNCKSFYGYKATKDICGNKSQIGHPKTSQLLQSLIYVDLGRRTGQFNYVKMIYYARDSANRAEFDIRLIQDNEVWRPTINGVIDYRFTMEDIYSRYQELKVYLDNDKIPPRDYEISWDTERVEKEFLLGNVAKTTYEDWKKNPKKNTVGNWQCNYCPFCNICYEK